MFRSTSMFFGCVTFVALAAARIVGDAGNGHCDSLQRHLHSRHLGSPAALNGSTPDSDIGQYGATLNATWTAEQH